MSRYSVRLSSFVLAFGLGLVSSSFWPLNSRSPEGQRPAPVALTYVVARRVCGDAFTVSFRATNTGRKVVSGYTVGYGGGRWSAAASSSVRLWPGRSVADGVSGFCSPCSGEDYGVRVVSVEFADGSRWEAGE